MPSRIASLGELRALIRRWQRRLGLADWRIELIVEDGLECVAEVRQHRNEYREAVIAVAPWLVGRAEYPEGMVLPEATWDRRRLEETVVHELLHIIVKPLERAVDLIDGHLHRDSAAILERAYSAAEERVVDALAAALVAAFADC